MRNSFSTDYHVTVMFPQFKLDSPAGLAIASIIFALASIVYEGLKCLRLNLAEKSGRTQRRCMTRAHLVQTLIHMVEFAFSYTLMLVVMTFNLYLFVAVVTGSALGMQGCALFRGSHTNRLVRSESLEIDCLGEETANVSGYKDCRQGNPKQEKGNQIEKSALKSVTETLLVTEITSSL